MRTCLRICLVLASLAAFLAPSLLRHPGRADDLRRANRWSRRFARIMGWRLHRHGPLRELLRPGLLVCNHLSWTDPLLMAAVAPLRFVTSREVERSRLLGDVSRRAGCVFTDRRSQRAILGDSRALVEQLRRVPVVVFPEATSTCGDTVLPFRPAFFQSALDAAVPVRTLCIRYRRIDGRPAGPGLRRRYCWYGDMRFLPHLAGLLRVRSLDAELHIDAPLECPPGMGRKALAGLAHQRVAARYQGGP